MNQGNVDKAAKQIAKILEKRSNYFPTRMLKGELLVKKSEFDAALALFDQLIAEEPGSARAYYFKGLSHFGLGDINPTAKTLSKAIELGPAFVNARLLMAEIYLRKRDFALAQEQALEILKMRPQNFQARLILGNAHMYRNKVTQATDIFKSLIETAPDNPVGYYRLGLLQRNLSQYDAAMANFEKALSINPQAYRCVHRCHPGSCSQKRVLPGLKTLRSAAATVCRFPGTCRCGPQLERRFVSGPGAKGGSH